MKLGMMLPIGVGALGEGRPPRWRELRELAKLAEAVGFDTLLAPDHLLFRRSPPGNVPAMTLPAGKTRGIWEAWSTLSAVAEATSRIQLGPLMACASFRNPALLAKMASTLDEISGGRLVLGLGAGWHQPEYQAFGFPFENRVSRFEEAIQIIVPLLREGRVDFQGQYYQARNCELLPRGPRPGGPPIFIGAQGPRMLRLAARYADTYDTDYQLDADAVARRFAALDAACAEVGRDPKTIGRAAGTRVALATEGPVDPAWQVGAPRDGVAEYDLDGARFAARHGTPDEILAHLRAFQAVGVEHVTVNVVHPPGLRGIERFAPVMAALRR
jgi:probable F420-dependent oxidoreductase